VLTWFLNTFPQTIPGLLDETLKQLVTKEPYIDTSYRVYDLERVNDITALSSEIAYPLDGNVYLDTVDSLLAVIKSNAQNGRHHTAPLALRFVAPSQALLSMFYNRRTCMVEFPLPVGTQHLEGMLDAYEMDAQRFQGRPHWGQWHRMPLTPGWAAGAYPRLDDWIRAYRQCNFNGVFDSPFTDHMGFRSAPTPGTPLVSTDRARVEELAALAEAVLPHPLVIPKEEIGQRAVLLIQRMHAPLASQLEQAVDFVQWGLPLLVPAFPPFSTLSLAQRQLAVSRCFHHKGLLRDLARAIKLLTAFPYYTDERVRATLGYVEFEHRPRATGLDLTPLTYPTPGSDSHAES